MADVLLKGAETEAGILKLLELKPRMNSESMKKALVRHFVNGWDEALIVSCCGVKASNLNRDIKKLNEVATIVNEYVVDHYTRK